MFTLYLASLVLGGILLGSSLVLGGHGDGDVASGDLEHDPGHPEVGASAADFVIGAFRSLRFWTFSTAFFGLTGLSFTSLGVLDSQIVIAFLAISMGLGAGLGAVYAIRRLGEVEESSSLADVRDYVGKTARVLVPVGPGQTGKVRLQLRGSTVDVLATSEDEELVAGSEAIVVDMEGTVARVTRYDAGASAPA